MFSGFGRVLSCSPLLCASGRSLSFMWPSVGVVLLRSCVIGFRARLVALSREDRGWTGSIDLSLRIKGHVARSPCRNALNRETPCHAHAGSAPRAQSGSGHGSMSRCLLIIIVQRPPRCVALHRPSYEGLVRKRFITT